MISMLFGLNTVNPGTRISKLTGMSNHLSWSLIRQLWRLDAIISADEASVIKSEATAMQSGADSCVGYEHLASLRNVNGSCIGIW
jgi:hypothetical protein